MATAWRDTVLVGSETAALRAVMTELEELLRVVVSSGSPPRTTAVRYTQYRDALLAAPSRSAVPGFIIQCVSIYKFQDFINLYDPRIDHRVAFIEAAFTQGVTLLKPVRRTDAFNDFDF